MLISVYLMINSRFCYKKFWYNIWICIDFHPSITSEPTNHSIFLSSHLKILFNQSLSSRIFSSILKTNEIKPMFIKGSKLEYSLLSNIDKILEKLMYNGLQMFLEKNERIVSLQFGFWQKYLNIHALIDLSDEIRNEISERDCWGLLYHRSSYSIEKIRILNGFLLILVTDSRWFQ